ncbi:MAG TPA: alkaline phosphatase, partial [Armatimonadota bacterium]|nr:alkaline phosphatase [Armatimonadota bacterium]
MRTMSRLSVALSTLLLVVASFAAPKNIIIMIGDGMGPDIVAAAGAYKYGTAYHQFGGDKYLTLETLANHRYVTTFSNEGKGYDFTWADGDRNYPMKGATDSAAAATALATGVKTYNKGIGVDPQKQPLINELQVAQRQGRKTGVITTVPFSHATPAGFSVHNPERDDYQGIAHELFFTIKPDVVMGAGNPDAVKDATKAYQYISKEDWDTIKSGKSAYTLVQSREEFQKLATTPSTTPVLGAFRNQSNLAYCKADRQSADPALPTLAEMADGTLNCLDGNNG